MSESQNNIDIQNKRDYLYALVLAVYRVTDKFPPQEHLRLKMREEALNILSHVEHIYAGKESDRYVKFVNSVRTLVHYCEIASEQKWLHESNFEVLKHELFKLRNSFEMPEQIEPIKEGIQEASYEVDLSVQTEAQDGLPFRSSEKAQDGLPFRSSERAEDGKNNDSVTSLNNERNPEHRPEHRPELAEGPVEGPRQASYAPPAGGPLYAGIYTGVEEAEEPHVELADERSPEHRPESVEGLAEEHAGSSLDIPERREKNYIQNSENVLKSASVSEAGNAKSLVSEFGEYAGAPRVSDDPGPLKATRARSEGSPLTDRHETILTHLGNNGAVQVADLSNILQDISPRTIRRDLDKLIKMGKVTKHGKTNGAKYRLA